MALRESIEKEMKDINEKRDLLKKQELWITLMEDTLSALNGPHDANWKARVEASEEQAFEVATLKRPSGSGKINWDLYGIGHDVRELAKDIFTNDTNQNLSEIDKLETKMGYYNAFLKTSRGPQDKAQIMKQYIETIPKQEANANIVKYGDEEEHVLYATIKMKKATDDIQAAYAAKISTLEQNDRNNPEIKRYQKESQLLDNTKSGLNDILKSENSTTRNLDNLSKIVQGAQNEINDAKKIQIIKI